MKRTLERTVLPDFCGKTVNDYLRRVLHLSGSLIKVIKKTDGALLLNDEPVWVNHTIKSGDRVIVQIGFDNEKSENIPSVAGELDVVYEDDDLLIVNKPPNMPTHPSMYHYSDSLANRVVAYYENMGQKFVFRCVTRLDKGTSGLCVIAKHAHAHEMLKKELHTGDFIREYTALVCGEISENGFVDAPIARETNSAIKRVVSENGERAYTTYTVEERLCNTTLLRLRLETGRTHQIRVHMAYIGHPLVGDFLYGSESELIKRASLHSSHIILNQPITDEKIELFQPLPDDMKKFIENEKREN